MPTPALLPLRGHRVIEVAQNLPGPLLGRILCDLGADVVKIEPAAGDPTRQVPPFMPPARKSQQLQSTPAQPSAIFAALNFGKRSVVLNLKDRRGSRAFRQLAEQADIVVESFRPGVMDRLGLGPETLLRRNPRLVYCAITGYGQDGALAQRAGHDINYIARAGLLSLSGPAGEPPTLPPTQLADIAGGAYPGAVAVLAALMQRQLDPQQRGRFLDIAITRQSLRLLALELPRRLLGHAAGRGDGMLTGGLPTYGVYRTRDGKFMALGALEPKFFARFCQLAQLEDIQDAGQATGGAARAVQETIAVRMAEKTQQQWCTIFADADVCCEAVRSPEAAFADPELGHTGHIVADGGRIGALRTDFGEPPAPASTDSLQGSVPQLGQHTVSVLEELDAALEEGG